MNSFCPLISILLLAAIFSCSNALPTNHQLTSDNKAKEEWFQDSIRNAVRFFPHEEEKAVKQTWKDIMRAMESQLTGQTQQKFAEPRSFFDRFTNSNSQIQRMGDEDVFDKEENFNDAINRITEKASKGQYGRLPIWNSGYGKAIIQSLFRMRGRPDSFRISFPWPSRDSVPSTDLTQPLENTESSTQQPASEVSSQLGDLLKELMALN